MSDRMVSTRVLLGESVFEDATLTLHDGRVWIEPERNATEEFDSVAVDEGPLRTLLERKGEEGA